MNIQQIRDKKKAGEKLVMLTAYDFPTASIVDSSGVDIILVGDSLANVVLGLESTKDVGMTEMLHHTRAVKRAVKNSLLVGDMPFESYQKNPQDAVLNAKRFTDAGCDAIKLEWFDDCLSVTEKIIKAGIPVMGHIGLTPQTADKLGGFKVQGKDADAARKIISQAKELQERGCFSVVLECLPDRLAKMITETLPIPTISCGAGPFCDGQVLVLHDLVGLFDRFQPKFAKRYVNAGELIKKGIEQFCDEVRCGQFPDKAHSYSISDEEFEKLK
jgi:3-methyl-2-oxobutanoate hydroxymethyltransferase